MVEGYNIATKINGKTAVGRTQDDVTIAARIIESITKDDAGETQAAVNGHDITFSTAGLIGVGNTDSDKIDRDDMIAQALKKGDDAIVPITYVCDNGDTYEGNAIMTQYRESSNATDRATWNADWRITGSFTKSGSGSGAGA